VHTEYSSTRVVTAQKRTLSFNFFVSTLSILNNLFFECINIYKKILVNYIFKNKLNDIYYTKRTSVPLSRHVAAQCTHSCDIKTAWQYLSMCNDF